MCAFGVTPLGASVKCDVSGRPYDHTPLCGWSAKRSRQADPARGFGVGIHGTDELGAL